MKKKIIWELTSDIHKTDGYDDSKLLKVVEWLKMRKIWDKIVKYFYKQRLFENNFYI